jgi:hypothetical protein
MLRHIASDTMILCLLFGDFGPCLYQTRESPRYVRLYNNRIENLFVASCT